MSLENQVLKTCANASGRESKGRSQREKVGVTTLEICVQHQTELKGKRQSRKNIMLELKAIKIKTYVVIGIWGFYGGKKNFLVRNYWGQGPKKFSEVLRKHLWIAECYCI